MSFVGLKRVKDYTCEKLRCILSWAKPVFKGNDQWISHTAVSKVEFSYGKAIKVCSKKD